MYNVHHCEFKMQTQVKFKRALNKSNSFCTEMIPVTQGHDTMYVLSALDESIWQISKCKQERQVSGYLFRA